ncbi:Major facilitator superfamily permease-Cdc91p [Phaffia rhodozyma]|uniref:Major facilitator superfamily permease-Cdc91p n=1 Tax=Phaffia rhodozyma TaxID=264483 RepID=A0A0F7SPU5_PHARH|nr:Major facilitator superfamily permease-Cdc91p [Phaffia rhodozyma]
MLSYRPLAFASNLSVKNHLVLAALLRLVFFAFLPGFVLAFLGSRPELSTPLTSFRRLREGLFLWASGQDPYDGGVFNHSPIYLYLFSTCASFPAFTSLYFIAADVSVAWALSSIWRIRSSSTTTSSERRNQNWSAVISFLYLWNPHTLLMCLAKSTAAIDNALVVLSIYYAVVHRPTASLLFLALSTLTSVYPALLLPFIVMILLDSTPVLRLKTDQHRTSRTVRRSIKLITTYALLLTGVSAALRGITGSWESVMKGPSIILGIKDLTPNVGLSWYFFTEMFDHFRPFFTMVFQAHLAIYVAPLAFAFHSDPLFGLLCQSFLISTLKTYPTVGDTALSASFLPLFPAIFPRISYSVVIIGLHVYSSVLFPLLDFLWLHAGSANANFFYAAGLVYGLGNVLLSVGVIWAGRTVEFEQSRGIMDKSRWKVIQVVD